MAPIFSKPLPPNPTTSTTVIAGYTGPAFATGPEGCVGMQVTDVLLSSAQLLALLGTPVNIVPAPGAGFMVVPDVVVIRFFGGSVAYTDAGGAVQFKVGSQVFALASNAIFLTTTSPNKALQSLSLTGAAGTAGNPPTDDNAPLTITKITNNFAAGNGTAKITLYYNIEPTS